MLHSSQTYPPPWFSPTHSFLSSASSTLLLTPNVLISVWTSSTHVNLVLPIFHILYSMIFKINFGILKSSTLTKWFSHYKSSGINIRYHISVVVGYTLEFQTGSNSPHSLFAYGTINSSQYSLFPSHEDRSSSACNSPNFAAICNIHLNGSFRCKVTEFNHVWCN